MKLTLSVEFYSFCMMSCLPGCQWVGEEKENISLIGLFPLCIHHGVIECSCLPLSEGRRSKQAPYSP